MNHDRVETYMKLAEKDVKLKQTSEGYYLTSKYWFDEFCPSWNSECIGNIAQEADAALSAAKLRALVSIKLIGLDTHEARIALQYWQPEPEDGRPDFKNWVRDYLKTETDFTKMVEEYGFSNLAKASRPEFSLLAVKKFLGVCNDAETSIYVAASYEGHPDVFYTVYNESSFELPQKQQAEEGTWNSTEAENICSLMRASYVLAAYGIDTKQVNFDLQEDKYKDKYGRLNWIEWAFDSLNLVDKIHISFRKEPAKNDKNGCN